ncbi:MAG: Dabb family protein [Bacteroidota bacterium]
MKTRRNFITKLGSLTALFALSSTRIVTGTERTATSFDSEVGNGKFIHVVFFWLVNDHKETTTRFLGELRKFIDNVDLIKTKHIGSPADTNREVIDSTYSYSLILSFDSEKEQELYQEHHLHKAFIENASSLWEKVLVYDSLEI